MSVTECNTFTKLSVSCDLPVSVV